MVLAKIVLVLGALRAVVSKVQERQVFIKTSQKSERHLEEDRRKRGRVVGGSDVHSITEYPSFVQLRDEEHTEPFCGGTILSPSAILTGFCSFG